MSGVVLFLDLDGVVRFKGDGSSGYLGQPQLNNLNWLVGAFDLPIVITSTWRLVNSLQWFKHNINQRVIGMTDDFREDENGSRQKEVEHWLSVNTPGSQWLALDDQAQLFLPNCKNLILCDPNHGFDGRALQDAIGRITSWLDS